MHLARVARHKDFMRLWFPKSYSTRWLYILQILGEVERKFRGRKCGIAITLKAYIPPNPLKRKRNGATKNQVPSVMVIVFSLVG